MQKINSSDFTKDKWVLSRGSSSKEPTCQCRRYRRLGFHPRVGRIPWRRAWQPTPVFLPGESHGQRSLAGCSPWGHEESDTTEATERTHSADPWERDVFRNFCTRLEGKGSTLHTVVTGYLQGTGPRRPHRYQNLPVLKQLILNGVGLWHSISVGSEFVGAEPADTRATALLWDANWSTCCLVLRHVWLLVTPWTVAQQATLSTEFSRQEY